MRTFLSAAALVLFVSPEAMAGSFTCPRSIETVETPAAIEGFAAEPATTQRAFRFVSFFDGDPKELADLAPDEQATADGLVQIWELVPTGKNKIVAVCRYHGTEATVRAVLPMSIQHCTLVTKKASPPELMCP